MTIAAPPPLINVRGNVDGTIVVGDNNFVVNTNYGTLVYKQAAPRVKLRDLAPAPPRQPRDFIGRADELAKLEKVIANRDVGVIIGIDGIGKTALIKQAASGTAARGLPNGIVYLEGIDEEGVAIGMGDVLQRLFDSLYESDPPLKVNSASARTYLSNTRPLVVLDRFNLDPVALSRLGDLFPQGALILTSTQPSVGEVAQPVKLGPLARAESTQLFATKAGITVDDSNRVAVDNLCELLADVPLAVVTLANVIREKSIALDAALQIVKTLQPTSADPLRAAIERAFASVSHMLSPEERKALSLAAALPGASVDRAWLESVAGGQVVIGKLESLGLLQMNSPRVRVPAGLRGLALAAADENAVNEQLLLNLRQSLARRSLDFDFIADELGNLIGLQAWTFERQRWGDVIAIGQAIDPYLTLRGLWDAWRTVLDRVLQAARASSNRVAEAWALHQLGTWEIGAGAKAQAITWLQQALVLRQSIGDQNGAAFTQHNLNFLLPPPPPPPSSQLPKTLPGRVGPRFSLLHVIALLGVGVILSVATWAANNLRIQFPELPFGVPTSTVTASPGLMDTPTNTPSPRPTNTLTATATGEIQRRPTNTATSTGTLLPTPTPTRASTATSTSTIPRAQPPAFTPTPTPTPQILFYADQNELRAGECTVVHWRTENISQVYYQGQPVVGDADQKECFNASGTFRRTLTVLRRDGGQSSFSITLNVFDATGPTISQIVESADPIWYISGCGPTSTTIKATVTDPSGVASVDIVHRVRTGTTTANWVSESMFFSGSNNYQITLNAPIVPSSGGFLDYYVQAWDKFNNSATSSSRSVTVKYCFF